MIWQPDPRIFVKENNVYDSNYSICIFSIYGDGEEEKVVEDLFC